MNMGKYASPSSDLWGLDQGCYPKTRKQATNSSKLYAKKYPSIRNTSSISGLASNDSSENMWAMSRGKRISDGIRFQMPPPPSG